MLFAVAPDLVLKVLDQRVAAVPYRHTDVDPYYALPKFDAYPFDGSAFVIWDTGIPAPPITNTPPREGKDPHSAPRSTPAARQQKATFLLTGNVVDVCNGQPCQSDFTRPPG